MTASQLQDVPHPTPLACASGPRLALRPVVPADAKGPYATWINDPAVKRYLAARYDRLSTADIEAYIAANRGDPTTVFLAICLKESGRHIGNIKLQNVDHVHRTASVSIVIGEKGRWGSGLGTEAIAITCQYVFDEMGLYRLDAGCFAENLASIRIFEKCGFKREGSSRQLWDIDGQRYDAVRLGLVRQDEPLWRRFLRAPGDSRD